LSDDTGITLQNDEAENRLGEALAPIAGLAGKEED
jgi:hypothetical protein